VVHAGSVERSQPGLSDFLKLLFSKTMAYELIKRTWLGDGT
jgi:hypothetical protein